MTLFRFGGDFISEKTRHTVWLPDDSWNKVESHYQTDNCTTKNEYIEKAIDFYTGYIDSASVGDYLPRLIGETLEDNLEKLGKRIGHLLFKLTVENNISNHILAADTDMDVLTYERLRNRSLREVKQTNGEISFKDDLIFQKSL